jgi:hypothetical protein
MIHCNKPFIKPGYLGLVVIMMSVLFLFIFPPKAPSLPEGFLTPIIAFEFIQTKTEVMEMFCSENITMRNEMARAMEYWKPAGLCVYVPLPGFSTDGFGYMRKAFQK